jgi:hypothetical protein
MAITLTHANNAVVKWRKQVWREFRRGNLFSPYMGESATSIIQIFRDLADGGDQLNVPIIGALRGPGVSTGPLTGNEEKIDNYGMRVWVDWSRNAILLNAAQMRKSAIDQMEYVRPLLTEWQQALLRDEIVLAFGSIPSESPPQNWGNEATAGMRVNGIVYDMASAAQKNKWHDDNSDRILYGVATGNFVAGNHAASLANVDSTNDRASAALLLLLKRMARRANPGLTPFKDDEDAGREWFVCFMGSNAFRDLGNDATIIQANLNARPREGRGMDQNPLFQDGDLLYRGIIIREIPEIDDYLTVTGAGASSIDVAPIFLCGQNAVALAWGQMPRPTERKEDDYGFLKGRGVESVYGVVKSFKRNPSTSVGANGKLVQWGMATAFVSSTPDT